MAAALPHAPWDNLEGRHRRRERVTTTKAVEVTLAWGSPGDLRVARATQAPQHASGEKTSPSPPSEGTVCSPTAKGISGHFRAARLLTCILISGVLLPKGSVAQAGAGLQAPLRGLPAAAQGDGQVRRPGRTLSKPRLPPALLGFLRYHVSKLHRLITFNILPKIHTQHRMKTFRVVKCI